MIRAVRNCETAKTEKIDRFKSQHDILVASSSLPQNDEPSQSTCTSPRLSDHWTSTSTRSILPPVKDVEHAEGECSTESPWIHPVRIQTQTTRATRSPFRTPRQKKIGNPPRNLVNTTVSQKTTVAMTMTTTMAENTTLPGTLHTMTTQKVNHNRQQATEVPGRDRPTPDHLHREKTKSTSVFRAPTPDDILELGYRRARCICGHRCRVLLQVCAERDELLADESAESEDPHGYSAYRRRTRVRRRTGTILTLPCL